MSKIIDEIIEEKMKKDKYDEDFYNGCKEEFFRSEETGCDFSDCKNFSDLCQKNNLFTIGLQN